MAPVGVWQFTRVGEMGGAHNAESGYLEAVTMGIKHSVINFIVLTVFLPLTLHTGGASMLPSIHLDITTVEIEPYVMVDNATGRFVGFIPDLLDTLAREMSFGYRLTPTADGSYGRRQADFTWDGIIGDLLSGEADVAAAPMYVTALRQRVVDFTVPFMSVQATVLLRKPPPGSSSHVNIRSISDLINQSEIKYGTLNRGRIFRAFQNTNDTALKLMWRNIQRGSATPGEHNTLTNSNQAGIDLVRAEKYAYIIPDSIGDYITRRSPCDLIAVGRFLMNESFALALPKSSNHKGRFDDALRQLHSSGYLARLKDKWWNANGECGVAVNAGRFSGPSRASHQHANNIITLLVLQVGIMLSL